MRNFSFGLFAGAAALVLWAAPSGAATLGIEVFDNSTLIDNLSGITTGTASLTTSDAAFGNITVNVQGSPLLPHADLSVVTLDASASTGFTGAHTLTIEVFQDSVTGHGPTQSTFTVNGLIGFPGPMTESTFEGGSATTLGTQLASHTFPVGLTNGSVGPLSAAAGAFSADAISYDIGFTAAHQSFGGSAELTTNVPEPSTWAMLALGFGGLVIAGWRKRNRPLSLAA